MRLCEVSGCNNKRLAKGMCRAHYLRLYKTGTLSVTIIRGLPAAERLLRKRRITCDGCWEYTGALTSKGYAQVACAGTMRFAHRIMYEDRKGKVPPGMELDHLCRNRACFNPDHLQAVSHTENMRRSPLVRNKTIRHRCRETGRIISGKNYAGERV